VASDRRLPRLLVELPAGLDDCLELAARLRLQVRVELSHVDETIAVGVERLEHLLVHVHLGAVALGQAERAEGAGNLINVELSIAIGVELREDHLHVVLVVASDRRLPRRLIKLPAGLNGHLELAARLGLQVRVELIHRNKAIAVGVERLEHGLVHIHLGAVALGQAKRAEGTGNLVNVELSIAIGVELREDRLHVVLLVACDRRVPRRLVKLPSKVDLPVDDSAQFVRHRLVKLLHCHIAVTVEVERLEHGLVHVRIPALALLEAQGAEGTGDLVDVELSIAIGVELCKERSHLVLALCAGLGRQNALRRAIALGLVLALGGS